MSIALIDKLSDSIGVASKLYNKLVIVITDNNSDRSKLLSGISKRFQAPLININAELSRLLLDLTNRQRMLQLPQILSKMIANSNSKTVVLDNIEILFDVSLQQDPIRLLKDLSRDLTIITGWVGKVKNNCISYAIPEHPEFHQYTIHDFLLVSETS